ncbi:MAG: family 10 glycosylhydrolase, partial [Angelakisella sp.]
MRKVLSLALAVMLLLSLAACKSGGRGRSDNIIDGSGAPEFSRPSSDGGEHTSPESPAAGEQLADVGSEVRGVWLSYLELTGLMKGKSEHEFRMGLAKVLDTCADFGLNTVILQVRPYGDAIYPSEIFPQSYLFTGEEGSVGKAPYDALAISVEEAHKRKLRLEAWINPYRVRAKADLPLSADNPAVDMLQSGDAIKLGELISYNPSSAAAQALIVAGITEIVESYDVDGIHFDDYFYPVTDESFDRRDYSAYKASGGAKDLAAWRRGNVTALVRKVHDAIEITKPSVRLGISPQGNIDNNLNKQFVDIEELIKAGLIDYICPQMYYGFNNDTCPYVATIKMFN